MSETVEHTTYGRHVLLDVWGVPFADLNDLELMKQTMRAAAAACQATVVSETFYRFPVQGLSGVLVLAESHISVHTTPEHEYASFDIFTCGENMDPCLAAEHIVRALSVPKWFIRQFERGTESGIEEVPLASMSVVS